MLRQKKGQRILACLVAIATAIMMASTAIGETPDPTAIQPQVEGTAPTATPEIKTAPASEQKTPDKPLKSVKKRGRITAMMLTLFAVITGHQGTTQ
jgi:hypothetical protein